MKKVILITGASSGMGKITAKELIKLGHTVYGVARRIDEMQDLESIGGHPLKMDLTVDEEIQNVVKIISQKEGRIDILINSAGYGSYGAVEDVPLNEARRQFEVNLFGLARVTQLVLPVMRKNSSGRIVNISSMGGKVYSPFGAWYTASKHALEGWSDSLRVETKPFGIDVVVIEPGGIKTPWGLIAAEHLKKTSGNGAYSEKSNKVADNMINMFTIGKYLTDEEVISKTIIKASLEQKPKTRYAVGYMAKPVLFIRRFISDRMLDRIVESQTK